MNSKMPASKFSFKINPSFFVFAYTIAIVFISINLSFATTTRATTVYNVR